MEGPWNPCPALLSTWGNGPERATIGSGPCSTVGQSQALHQVPCCLVLLRRRPLPGLALLSRASRLWTDPSGKGSCPLQSRAGPGVWKGIPLLPRKKPKSRSGQNSSVCTGPGLVGAAPSARLASPSPSGGSRLGQHPFICPPCQPEPAAPAPPWPHWQSRFEACQP